MPPRFTNISLKEMSALLELNAFEYTKLPNTYEYVFQKYVEKKGQPFILRVYTGIDMHTDNSREVGSDAIRVVAVFGNKAVAERRVNRTQGWVNNLQERILHWADDIRICPQCGNLLNEKQGKYGPFMGCSTFPRCGYTEKV